MPNTEVKFRYLSQEDMIKAGVLDMHKCVQVIDGAFKLMGKGDYLHGGPLGEEHGMMVHFPKEAKGPRMPVAGPDRRYMAMVGYVGGDYHVCGVKWYGSNRANVEKGLPRSILMVSLNDADTGAPIAIMEGNLISAMRTGAMPGVAAKYLAKKNASVVGIIGAGVISRPCLMSIAETVHGIKEVKVFDLVMKQSEAFCKDMKDKLHLNVHPVDSFEEAVRGSDVLSYATSGVKAPFTPTEWLTEGVFISLSAVADFEKELYLKSRIVADNWKMHTSWRKDAEEKGEKPMIHAVIHELIREGKLKDENIENLAPIAMGTKPGRTNDKERIFLITGGLPTQDITWGYTVYQQALKMKLGQELKVWQKPYWA